MSKKVYPTPDFIPAPLYPCATCKDHHYAQELFWAGRAPKGIEDAKLDQHQWGWHCNECIFLEGHKHSHLSLKAHVAKEAP